MRPAQIVCPTCGWEARSPGAHAHAFRYIEDVTSVRWVMGVAASGALLIAASDRILDEEGGRSPRLQCGECLAEFSLPGGMDVEFVC